MKLLFDENLSPKLANMLADEYPGSIHVRNVGLRGTEDDKIWNYSKDNDFILVSKNTDFRERSFIEGYPPKIIWLDVGNAGTQEIKDLLRRGRSRIEQFEKQQESSFLILSIRRTVI